MTTSGTAKTVTVGAIIWRNKSFLRPFVESLVHSAGDVARLEVVLVFNEERSAEYDSIVSLLRRDDRVVSVKIFDNRVNVGYATAMNQVASAATADVLVLANLDLVFAESALARIAHLAEQEAPAWDIVVPRIFQQSGDRMMVMGAGQRGLDLRITRFRAPTLPTYVYGGTGALIVLRREVVEARVHDLGALFEPEYHSFGEDQCLYWWAARRKVQVLYEPGIVAWHRGAGSFDGRQAFRLRPRWVQVQVVSNYRLNCLKYLSFGPEIAGALLGELSYLGRVVAADGLRGGVRIYATSWRRTFESVRKIRARRQRLRPVLRPQRLGGFGSGAQDESGTLPEMRGRTR